MPESNSVLSDTSQLTVLSKPGRFPMLPEGFKDSGCYTLPLNKATLLTYRNHTLLQQSYTSLNRVIYVTAMLHSHQWHA